MSLLPKGNIPKIPYVFLPQIKILSGQKVITCVYDDGTIPDAVDAEQKEMMIT